MNQVLNHRNTLRQAPGWVHGIVWSIFGGIFFILLILFCLYQDMDIWFLWMGHSPKPTGAFAEAVHPGIFRTPANTWSNLAFVLVGIYIVAFAWWDAHRKTTKNDSYAVRQPALMCLYGVSCIVLGFGSGAMHASLMSWGHKFDVLGMFFTFLALIALQWARWVPSIPLTRGKFPSWPLFGMAVIALSILLLFTRKGLGGSTTVLAILFWLAILGVSVDAVARRTSQQYRWLLLAFGTLAVAGYLQRHDVARRFTPSDSWLQGHAIWHLLCAVFYGSMANFYRSEVPRHPPEGIFTGC